jgi:hypothetical protein
VCNNSNDIDQIKSGFTKDFRIDSSKKKKKSHGIKILTRETQKSQNISLTNKRLKKLKENQKQ